MISHAMENPNSRHGSFQPRRGRMMPAVGTKPHQGPGLALSPAALLDTRKGVTGARVVPK